MISNLFTQKGASLIELMVSLTISSIVAAGVYGVFYSQQRVFKESEQVIAMQRNSRIALNRMKKDIRMAGYNPAGIFNTEKIIKATKHHLKFNDGTQTVSYDFDNNTGELLRGNAVIANNITTFSFNYFLIADSTSTAKIRNAAALCCVTSTGLFSTKTPKKYGFGYIRSIGVNITYKAKYPDPDYTNPDGINGNFRTLPVNMVIKTRNIGLTS